MILTTSQPDGTPTWVDLGIPDLDRAMAFYGALFGWEFEVLAEAGGAVCLLNGHRAAGLIGNADQGATRFWWQVYFATADCDATAKRITDAGGTLVHEPMDAMGEGRVAVAKDPVGAQFGLWQAGTRIGAEVVNEPGALLRNDLVTPTPEPARAFYAAVFDFTLDGNEDMPEMDFTFLRRPDGHEIGGIIGLPGAPRSEWGTLFMVADADVAVERARAGGGSATDPEDFVYGRTSIVTDPFGTEFTVGAAPSGGSA